MVERQSKNCIILGSPGAGKSWFARENVVNKLLKQNKRVLIIAPAFKDWKYIFENQIITDKEATALNCTKKIDFVDIKTNDKNTFSGVCRVFITKDSIKHLKDLRNCCLVLDDCRQFMSSNLQDELETLISRLRHQMVDLFVIGQAFRFIPVAFFSCVTEMFLFQTTGSIDAAKNRLADWREIEHYQKDVNRQAKTNKHYYKYIQIVNTDYDE